jgi:hypothetical protein
MASRFFRNLELRELSIQRIGAAFARRIKALPHNFAWKLYGGAGTSNFKKLKRYEKKHLGDRCFILGNGPSLQRMDLMPLRDEVTFGSNRIYLLFDKLGFETTYYVSTNDLVLKQCAQEIERIKAPKFINWRIRHKFSETEFTSFIHELYRPHFSSDITEGIWGGATVTFAMMQIAYYMGFEKVILIGVDHNFSTKGTPHKVVVAGSDDENHFDPKYFSDGFRWQLPDLNTSELAYRMAKSVFEADGRSILDATVDGKLTVFPKINYTEILLTNG